MMNRGLLRVRGRLPGGRSSLVSCVQMSQMKPPDASETRSTADGAERFMQAKTCSVTSCQQRSGFSCPESSGRQVVNVTPAVAGPTGTCWRSGVIRTRRRPVLPLGFCSKSSSLANASCSVSASPRLDRCSKASTIGYVRANIDLDATETLHSVACRVGRWYTAAPAARGRRNRPFRHMASATQHLLSRPSRHRSARILHGICRTRIAA